MSRHRDSMLCIYWYIAPWSTCYRSTYDLEIFIPEFVGEFSSVAVDVGGVYERGCRVELLPSRVIVIMQIISPSHLFPHSLPYSIFGPSPMQQCSPNSGLLNLFSIDFNALHYFKIIAALILSLLLYNIYILIYNNIIYVQ